MDHVEQYTYDWFSPNIENWIRWLAEFRGKPGIRCMEIGSYEGRATVWLLQNILTGEGSSIDCFDLFEFYYFDRFRANIAPWKDRVRLYPGAKHVDASAARESLAWPSLKVGGLMIFDDYMWLPADLTPPADGWSPEVQLQALAKHSARTPKIGIDAFLAGMLGHYEVVEQGYQMVVRKTHSGKEFRHD